MRKIAKGGIMRGLIYLFVTVAGCLMATGAWAQCKDKDGYVFVFSACQQQETAGKPDLCQHAPGDDPDYVLFMSNVIVDEVANLSSLGSLFFYVAQSQHGIELQGTSSECFATFEAAAANRKKTIARYRDNFSNVVVKDVAIEEQ